MRYGTPITRRSTNPIDVGGVLVGGEAPIAVQSMTDTNTADTQATLAQIQQLHEAGADLVRVSCPDEDSTASFGTLVRASPLPLIADIHFHYKRGVEAAKAGAACLRINPGNIGSKPRVAEIVRAAKDNNCAIRIGVNSGSLPRKFLDRFGGPTAGAMVESALEQLGMLEDQGFERVKISVKASEVGLMVESYRQLAARCSNPLHVGVTEAGAGRDGLVRSSIGIGALLLEGIGDTVRVSLSAPPVEEVHAAYSMLNALGLRRRGVVIVSCPSCARTGFDVARVARALQERLNHVQTPLTVSVLGCVVNGPGEALVSDIGLTGGGAQTHALYVNGAPIGRVKGDENAIIEALEKACEQKIVELDERAAQRADLKPTKTCQPTAPQPIALQSTALQPSAPQPTAPQPIALQSTALQSSALQPSAPQPTAQRTVKAHSSIG